MPVRCRHQTLNVSREITDTHRVPGIERILCRDPIPDRQHAGGHMNDHLFDRPLFLRSRKYTVQEIATLGDAIDFLCDWPEPDRDMIYETALRACIEAHDGLRPLSVARHAIQGFARKKGILEDPAEMMPWLDAGNSGRSGRSPA